MKRRRVIPVSGSGRAQWHGYMVQCRPGHPPALPDPWRGNSVRPGADSPILGSSWAAADQAQSCRVSPACIGVWIAVAAAGATGR